MNEEEKARTEELVEQKKKEIPWYRRLPSMVLLAGAAAAVLIIRSMFLSPDSRNTYLVYLGVLLILLYLLAQNPRVTQEEIVSPKEAELLVERECERKLQWGQFPPMSEYKVGPVSRLHHKDSTGMFYEVAVTLKNPYDRPRYYIGTVIARGEERTFTTVQEAVSSLTGRERFNEKTLIPETLLKMRDFPVLEKVFFNRDRERGDRR